MSIESKNNAKENFDHDLEYKPEWREKVTLGVISALALGVILAIYSPAFKAVHQRAVEREKKATLIGKRGQMTSEGYVGAMFFDTDGNVNTTNKMAQFMLDSSRKIENVRNIPTGTVFKVSEWEGILSDTSQKCIWRELKFNIETKER